MKREYYNFENIRLLPKKCIVESRKDCDASVQLGKFKFKLPIVPANMTTVISETMALFLAKNNYFYIMHRFEFDNVAFVAKMKVQNLYSSISLGIKLEDYNVIDELKAKNLIPDFITIDIAHGHSQYMEKMLKYIKINLPQTFVIAGNIATVEAAQDLVFWGADCVKVGIGPGKVCTTKLKTGFGTAGWQPKACLDIFNAIKQPIILDGGLREHGDIAKAIRFGATICMVGAILAGLEESPGKTVQVDGQFLKEYYGSASVFNKKNTDNIEGKRIFVPIEGNIASKLREINQDLQSAISYSGGNKLFDLRTVDYVLLVSE
ncbi:GMP reductase [Spiroplasma endosymbiont of Eupeodes luniger]|uniref:GMP reductase n=1 Tax=Spiroplasma endosymbiont of Eupeodes luniger TaxID=3066300 RepID=UPI0030D1FA52